ncbi:hypothetical protein Pcinc_025703 [Petrolisthes cinctipes]|uniref:Genetic suppressor element 1 n=1 Tax=Petrolisthes cinctipes TaxID=88211 RepID=A0AAE1F8Q9_PETCI|nr:hypothetical protein Pcinc_025703 [Petrolisthes cinctipes]
MKPVFARPEGGGGDGNKRVTCYVCGCPRCAEYPLAVRQQASGPYFPFLETHEPPDGSEPPSPDGRVLSCFLCYSYLTQQWQLYERDKVPPVKRIYWLKRVDNGPYTGVEVGVQSEYASQLLGLAPDPPTAPVQDVKRAGPSSGTRTQMPAHPPPPPHSHPHPPVTAAQPTTGPIPTPAPTPVPTPAPTSSLAPPVEVKRPRVIPPQPQPPSVPLPPPGVPPLPLGLSAPQISTQQEALDLSVESRRGVKREREEEPTRDKVVVPPHRTEVLDLRMPDKNATTEVCYVCGDHYKKGTLVNIYATQQSGPCPFFPSLVLHPRPSKSHPMEASGRVQGCRECVRHLQAQWDAYEAHKVPLKDREYSLRKRSKVVMQDTTGFVCYKCGRECPSSALCLIYCRPNSEKEPYYPFIEKLNPPEGASPISPQGMVQVCTSCSHSIPLQARHDLGKKSPEPRGGGGEGGGAVGGGEQGTTTTSTLTSTPTSTSQTPVTRPPSASAVGGDGDSPIAEATCYLCHQNHSRQTMHWLAMVAEGSTQDGMYFSFLKYLPRIGANSVMEGGRVLACSLCHQHLSTQWAEYEKDKVTVEHRQFSLRVMPINSPSPRLTPGPPLSSPGMSPHSDASPPHCFAAAAEVHLKEAKKCGSYSGQPLHTLEMADSVHDPSEPALPVITTQKALNIAVNCFVCSFHSKPGQTYALRSRPLGGEPFFPFLAKHQSAHPEARVDESCVLACLCCFHSLLLQWQKYEKEQVAHYARLYDTYNYTCFICSLKTYRKRLYLLPVKDYPFLKEHHRPAGGMVVESGHSVVVCKDCFSSLKTQYLDLERWGVPVEKRQYNWIQRPPPPDFHKDTPAKSTQVFPSGTQPSGAELGSSSPGSHPGTPPGALSQPGGVGSPREAHVPVTLGSTSATVGESGTQAGGIRRTDTPPTLIVTSALTNTPTTPTNTTKTLDSAPEAGKIHSSTPSCYAPLQLQNGIARQGGSRHSGTVSRQHSVAPGEGFHSGDITKQSPPRKISSQQVNHLKNCHRILSLSSSQGPTPLTFVDRKQEQSTVTSEQHKVLQHVDPKHHQHRHQVITSPQGPIVSSASSCSTPNNNTNFTPCKSLHLNTLKDSTQEDYKKRKSVIRAMSKTSVPTTSNSSTTTTTTTTSPQTQLSCSQLLPTSQELQAECS